MGHGFWTARDAAPRGAAVLGGLVRGCGLGAGEMSFRWWSPRAEETVAGSIGRDVAAELSSWPALLMRK